MPHGEDKLTVGAGMKPVWTGPLLRDLQDELVALLKGLADEEWDLPAVGEWRVRDVAAHLLDSDLRRLSIARDGFAVAPAPPIEGPRDLVAWLDRLNAQWVMAARRLSTPLLVDLIEFTGQATASVLALLDPDGPAPWPVAWAGEQASSNALDIGREFTERWHHQDQIREAVGAPPLFASRFLHPVLDISMFALPHAFRHTDAEPGAELHLRVTGDAGGDWTLQRGTDVWTIVRASAANPTCAIEIADHVAARLLMHRLQRPEARDDIAISGRTGLAAAFLAARAVMV